MALSPWPTTPEALVTATAELRRGLGLRANDSGNPDDIDLNLQRTAAAASARIEKFAPAAPQAVRDECVVRMVAWLKDTLGASRYFRPDEQVRTLNPPAANRPAADFPATDWSPASPFADRAFRASGAMALLGPWRPWVAS